LYNVCKVWGHVKYYHPEVANGNINWDSELLSFVSYIRNVENHDAFNDSLFVWINELGEIPLPVEPEPVFVDSICNITDYSWIDDPFFSDSVSNILNVIIERYRPQTNVYLSSAPGAGNPLFDNDVACNSYNASEGLRILTLYRYWNIINYFFPYKNIMDQDWDITLIEFIPQIIEAQYNQDFHKTFKRLTTRLNDSHAILNSSYFSQWIGIASAPFKIRFIENETVITYVKEGITEISVGDVIKSIDGVDIYHLRDSLRPYAYGSNDVIIERELNSLIKKGYFGGFELTVNNGITDNTVYLNRSYSSINDSEDYIWKDTTISDGCTFGIVNMGLLNTTHIETMFNDLWETDAIIFDIRNYPNGTLWTIVNYLYPSSIHIANFTKPSISYPGKSEWVEENIGSGTSNIYQGNIIILFDERTQSQAEYTCMGLEQFPGAIKIGSTTSAADGNVSVIELPYGISTYATFLGTFYSDYTPTQRVGIIPDYEVLPTIQGIRDGRDEVLEFALNCNFAGIDAVSFSNDLYVYPNPANNMLIITSSEVLDLISIYSLSGTLIKKLNCNTRKKEVDISGLDKGVYIVKTRSGNKNSIKKIIVD
jgi:hypothetical protein